MTDMTENNPTESCVLVLRDCGMRHDIQQTSEYSVFPRFDSHKAELKISTAVFPTLLNTSEL